MNSYQELSRQKSSSRPLFMVLLTAILTVLVCRPVNAQEQPLIDARTQVSSSPESLIPDPVTSDSGSWHFSVSPYLWFAGNHGTVGALGRDVGVHASAGDLLSHLDIGLMGAAEARFNRFVLNGDMLWVRISDSKAVPFPALGALSADARVGQFIWTSKFGYRVLDRKKLKVDANVGVRYWHLGQSLSFNPSVLGIDFSGSRNWADILIGGRVQVPLGKKTVIDLAGDVGGWGASAKLDYQFATLLSYKICPKWTMVAGYRYLFVDYRPTNLSVYNTVTSGALLGVTYTFK